MKLPASVRVDVTQDDIDHGVISNERCPIAIAFRRSVNMAHHVSVDPWRIDATEPTQSGYCHLVSYCLPENATNFVQSFDDHQPVAPFSFEVTRS